MAEGEPFPILHSAVGPDITPEKDLFLCRCGESKNKSYCDGAQARAGYQDENHCTNDALLNAVAPGITVHFGRRIRC